MNQQVDVRWGTHIGSAFGLPHTGNLKSVRGQMASVSEESKVSVGTQVHARVSTGCAGLDDILGGGLPRGHLYLIEGDPGAGKTTLALQFTNDGVKRGERTT